MFAPAGVNGVTCSEPNDSALVVHSNITSGVSQCTILRDADGKAIA